MDNGSAGDESRKKVGKISKFWLRPNLPIFPTFFLDPSPYPLCIRIHYESVYPSIIHHVSLSIILSRLRIHFLGTLGTPALPSPFVVCLLFVHCLLFIVCCLLGPPGPWAPLLALGPFWPWAQIMALGHFPIVALLAIGYWRLLGAARQADAAQSAQLGLTWQAFSDLVCKDFQRP